jgi:hypothetical protein
MFKVEGDVIDQTIAPLLFIPFLENSLSTGSNHQINEGYVYVNMKVSWQQTIASDPEQQDYTNYAFINTRHIMDRTNSAAVLALPMLNAG